MRNRTAIYVVAGLMIFGAQLAGLYVIVTNQREPDMPLPTLMPFYTPTPPPIPLNAQPWTQPVSTDYACLYFYPVHIDLRTGTQLLSDPPPDLTNAQLDGRTSSPDGQHEIIQQGAQVFARFSDSEPLLIADTVALRAWELTQWSPDSRYAAVEANARLYILDAKQQQVIQTISLYPEFGPLMYSGWSADSVFLAFADYPTLRVWSAADGRITQVPLPPEGVLNNQYLWSPQGHRLAYVWFVSGSVPGYLSVYIPGEDRQPRFELPLSWTDSMEWSPDNRWLVVQQQAAGDDYQNSVVNIFSVEDGAAYETFSIPRIFDAGGWLQAGSLLWAADSHSLLWHEQYWEQTQTPDYDYQLKRYDLPSRSVQTMAIAMPRPPVYAPDGKRIALTMRSDQGVSIELVNDDASSAFIQEADDAGDPSWSPDGRYIVAVWARGREGGRRVYLSWMRADGTARRTLDDGFWDVRDLAWLNDNRSLAYIAKRREGYSLELLDLETGETRTLLDGLDEVRELTYADGLLRLAWRKGIQAALSAYDDNGEPAYTLAWEDALQVSEQIALFFSPDQQYAAIKTGEYYHERLYLARTYGSSGRMVRSELYGLGDPLWSPDSKMLAFTQAPGWSEMSLEVVTADGDDLWRADSYPDAYRGLAWQRCT